MKLSDFVIQRIYKAGVKHVFMLPGGGAMHLNDSLGKSKNVDFASTKRQLLSTNQIRRLRYWRFAEAKCENLH